MDFKRMELPFYFVQYEIQGAAGDIITTNNEI